MAPRLVILGICDNDKDPLVKAGDEYLQRCRGVYAATRVSLKSTKNKPAAQAVADEGKRLLAKSEGCLRVALDVGGEMLGSPAFARSLARWIAGGRKVAFLLGGPEGHHRAVIDAADHILSVSPMTLPHRLCYALLAEQVYRAQEIERGGPYHKARRPG